MLLQLIDDEWPDEKQFVIAMENLIKFSKLHEEALSELASDPRIHQELRTFVAIALFVAQAAERAGG